MPTDATGWHRQDIIAELRKRGTSLAAIARQTGFARCTMVWSLMKPHERANVAVSAALDVPLHELWPDWYGPDGAPLWRITKSPTPARAHPRETRARLAAPHSAQTKRKESRGRPRATVKTASKPA